MSEDPHLSQTARSPESPNDADGVSIVELLTWIGQGKRLIAVVTVSLAAVSLAVSFMLTPIYSARTTLLPPGSQQQSGSAAALAALGSLGGLAGGLAAKTPDELYVLLLRSDSITRILDQRFELKSRLKAKSFEALRQYLPNTVRISSDRKTGVISVEVDDESPKFAADLANAFGEELTKLLGRLAVNEAQRRRLFFEQQLNSVKDDLVKAETNLQRLQERSGVIVLDKQAEALIAGATQVRAMIAEREIRLKVLRTSSTDVNPDVLRLNSEIGALRAELARLESSQDGNRDGGVGISVGKIPEAAIEYVRARRELKLQEALLESMVRQVELARMDEAKEGPLLQQIDVAVPPDYKSKPSRALIVLMGTFFAFFLSTAWVVFRSSLRRRIETDPARDRLNTALRQSWRIRT